MEVSPYSHGDVTQNSSPYIPRDILATHIIPKCTLAIKMFFLIHLIGEKNIGITNQLLDIIFSGKPFKKLEVTIFNDNFIRSIMQTCHLEMIEFFRIHFRIPISKLERYASWSRNVEVMKLYVSNHNLKTHLHSLSGWPKGEGLRYAHSIDPSLINGDILEYCVLSRLFDSVVCVSEILGDEMWKMKSMKGMSIILSCTSQPIREYMLEKYEKFKSDHKIILHVVDRKSIVTK